MRKKNFKLVKLNGVYKLLYGDNKKTLGYKKSYIQKFKNIDESDDEYPKNPPGSDFVALWTTDNNNVIELPILDTSKLRINWGDGTINNKSKHIYTEPGEYTITIKGSFSFDDGYTPRNIDLKQILTDLFLENINEYTTEDGYMILIDIYNTGYVYPKQLTIKYPILTQIEDELYQLENQILEQLDSEYDVNEDISDEQIEALNQAFFERLSDGVGDLIDEYINLPNLFIMIDYTLLKILDWGGYVIKNGLLEQFPNVNLTEVQGVPLIQTTDISGLFASYKYERINGINDWDTSKVTNMNGMFNWATEFNQPLNFDTSSVTDMGYMFSYTYSFNSPIDFDTSKVEIMSYMFLVSAFNQPVNFDTSSVVDMSNMFHHTTAFNQPLNFDTSNVTNMSEMFVYSKAFNQPLNFDTSKVSDMSGMFRSAQSFNQPLEFDTSSVTDMGYMFNGALVFNQPVNFDTSSVTNMTYMFYKATSFNQPLRFSNASNPDITNMLDFIYAMTHQVEWYQ